MADMQLGTGKMVTNPTEIEAERVGLGILASLDHSPVRRDPKLIEAWIDSVYQGADRPDNVVVLAATDDLEFEEEHDLWLAVTNAGATFDSLSDYRNDTVAAVNIWRARLKEPPKGYLPPVAASFKAVLNPSVNWDTFKPFECSDEELLQLQEEMAKPPDFSVVF